MSKFVKKYLLQTIETIEKILIALEIMAVQIILLSFQRRNTTYYIIGAYYTCVTSMGVENLKIKRYIKSSFFQ